MHVADLMNTNAGDEQHEGSQWVDCPACGYDNPADYSACSFCGADLEVTQ